MHVRLFGLLVVVALATAACGSTVQSSGPQALDSGRDEGLGTNAGERAGGVLNQNPGGGNLGAGFSSGVSGAPASGAPGTSGFPSGTGGARTKVPGVTEKEVFVGFVYIVYGEAANDAAGIRGVTYGDQKAQATVMIADINARGGVAGRKLVPVWYEVDVLRAQEKNALNQAMCEYFTNDHPVFAVLTGTNETLVSCLEKRGVLTIEDNLAGVSADFLRRYPHYLEISPPNLDRLMTAEVRGLAAQNYFSPWNRTTGSPGATRAKVGILTWDILSFRNAVGRSLLPALRSAGYAPASEDVVYVAEAEPAASSEISQAVLKFNADGVTHVLIMDFSGGLTLVFLTNANSQGYRPRYGFNTDNSAQLALDGGMVPPEQMRGAKGIGFYPIIDLRLVDNPDDGPYSNDERRRCSALMRKHGLEPSDPNGKGVMHVSCNKFRFLRDGITMGGPAISRDAFVAAVERMGSSFRSGSTFRTRFGPTKHDGADGFRYYAFVDACECMRYQSEVKSF